jgi:uncharacterized membrane-anchored protein
MIARSGLLAATLALALAAPALAGGKAISPAVLREISRPGPLSIEVGPLGTFRVPTGYRFIGPDKLADFHELFGDAAQGTELGALVPDDGGYVVYLCLGKEPVEDPLTNLKADDVGTDDARAALLKWTEDRLGETAGKRANAGLPPQKVTGWTHKPAYDADKKRLTFGVRVAEDSDRADDKRDELHHRTVVYGPAGQVVTLRTVTTSFKKLDTSLEAAKQLAGEVKLAAEDGTDGTSNDVEHYAMIGGAGILGVGLALVVAKGLFGKKRSSAPSARPAAARKFGSPR